MRRVMIIPAAGAGSRLGAELPKFLVEVNGRPMLDWLLDLYAPLMDEIVLVVSPAAEALVRAHLVQPATRVRLAVQASPTGMLDAILIPMPELAGKRPLQVWVTWCDQVGVLPETVRRLRDAADGNGQVPLVLPTSHCEEPYIHFQRNTAGEITAILHRREGDVMPLSGESDMGLFVLSDRAYFELLPEFAQAVTPGEGTGERNFLPFIAWLRTRGGTCSVPATHEMEAVGINTPVDLQRVGEWLRNA
jgi:bifunctional N-acetylglucosamine-1-phosphate-uridyltransferase/glucosamine-1-phosphate-acetyltransferase GlmU-like protein